MAHYTLVGEVVRDASEAEWKSWTAGRNPTIMQTILPDTQHTVATYFLGVDISDNPDLPMMFNTTVVAKDTLVLMWRAGNYLEASIVHDELVRRIIRGEVLCDREI